MDSVVVNRYTSSIAPGAFGVGAGPIFIHHKGRLSDGVEIQVEAKTILVSLSAETTHLVIAPSGSELWPRIPCDVIEMVRGVGMSFISNPNVAERSITEDERDIVFDWLMAMKNFVPPSVANNPRSEIVDRWKNLLVSSAVLMLFGELRNM